MKHTLLLLVHKNVEQVELLLKNLIDEKVNAVVHVDAKKEDLKKSLKSKFKDYDNVIIITDSVEVNWSGVSIVDAEIKLMKAACEFFPDSNYYHLISGECVNLYPVNEWGSLLDGKSFIDSREAPEYEWRIRRYMPFGESKYNRSFFLRLLSKAIKEGQRCFPLRKNFGEEARLKGGQWFSLTGKDMKLVVSKCNSEFMSKFKHTRCADEHFLQIIAHQLSLEFHPYDLRYTVWEKGASSPKYLNYEELVWAKESKAYLFARKVTPEVLTTYLDEDIA